jgi:uncharacterized protein YneF (UPF0154 family)
MSTPTRQQALQELYRRGILSWKCHPVQKEMYDLFQKAPKNDVLVWLLARQSGKSYLLAILALEAALKEPHSIVKLLTDTKLHIKAIFDKIFQEILDDCPESLKPKYHRNFFMYEFPNGSQIQLAGSDGGHYEKLRGQKCDLVLVDEAGFCNDLENVVKSVLMPTTTHTGGKIVLASTPPEDLEHDFLKFIEAAQFAGNLTKKTIDDNPLLDADQVKRIETAMGGRTSERFRREYLCEIIKNADISVIPEFNEELEKEIVKDWPRPPHYDCYESMDLGGKDLTVVLLAYYDFRGAKLIIEDELVLDFSKPNIGLSKLLKDLKEKENARWTNIYTNETKKPYIRVSDINYIVTQEIAAMSHGEVYFGNAKKDDKDAAINNLRTLLANKKIIIHPRCTTLIRHLKNVRWFSAKNKNTFARSPDNGHYDAVDALIYLTRTVAYTKNPYPAGYDLNMKDLFFVDKNKALGQNKQIDVFKQIFKVNKR